MHNEPPIDPSTPAGEPPIEPHASREPGESSAPGEPQSRDPAGSAAPPPHRAAVTAEERARGAASQQLDGAADAVRRAGRRAREQGGVLGRAEPVAHRVGDGLQGAARYVREHDVGSMRHDLEHEVRASPVRSLAVAAAVGFVFGRLLR